MELSKITPGGRISPARKTGARKRWELSDTLRERIAACAREDAAQGVYMGPEFLCLRKAEAESVAPDRAALERAIDTNNARAKREAREADERWLRLLSGDRYRVKRQSQGTGSAIQTYTAGVGWQKKESKAENQVHGILKAVYLDAYRAARTPKSGLDTEA